VLRARTKNLFIPGAQKSQNNCRFRASSKALFSSSAWPLLAPLAPLATALIGYTFTLREITKYGPDKSIHTSIHRQNTILQLLEYEIIDKQNDLATFHNIKTHTKNQNKELRENQTYQGMNFT